jgi:predicted metal-binding membrane protein
MMQAGGKISPKHSLLALILLMLAIGMGNLGWMLLLDALIAAGKNLAWGEESAPFGDGFAVRPSS